MNELATKELARWIIRSDRRLVSMKCFKHNQFLRASDIANETGRSIQNISTALKEMNAKGIVEQLDPGQRSWKKFELTSLGRTVLGKVERELSIGMFERMAGELPFKYVREVYRLVVTNPIVVTKDMHLHEVIDRILSDPRTRSAYVVDEKRRLIGMIGLKQMLSAIEGSLSLSQKNGDAAGHRARNVPSLAEDCISEPVTICEDDQLSTALKRMLRHNLEDLPVVDQDGVLIGELNGFEILLLGSQIMKQSVLTNQQTNTHSGKRRR